MEIWKRKEKQFEIIIEEVCKCPRKIRWIRCLIEGLGCIKEFDSSIENQIKRKQTYHKQIGRLDNLTLRVTF